MSDIAIRERTASFRHCCRCRHHRRRYCKNLGGIVLSFAMIDAQQIRNMMKVNTLFFGKRCLDSRKSGKFAMILYENMETESLIDVVF